MNSQKKETSLTEVSAPMIADKKEIVKTDDEIDAFIAVRQAFIQKVNAICVEGKDYHIIQGKKSLAKGGAEKIASIFKWTAKFDKDTESLEMLGMPPGLVAFKCTLQNGGFIGEGRGAASLGRNNGDANKTLKMAQKSAFIDAVLRASGLSDFYTQDLEDMPNEQISQPKAYTPAYAPKIQATPRQKEFIKKLCLDKGITIGQVKELSITYNTPSALIDYLKNLPNKEELPVIQTEEVNYADHLEEIKTDSELEKIADNVPF